MGKLSFRLPRVGSQTCLLCHGSAAGDGLCAACLADLSLLAVEAGRVCPRCASVSSTGSVCGRCQQKPPPFERLWASVYYEPPLSGVLHRFKHLRDASLAAPLAALMRALPPPWLAETEFDAVLAMPLSRPRRLLRGFNQCEELAHLLADVYGWNMLPPDTASRLAGTPQSTLAYRERLRNVRHSFEIAEGFANCKILLIDDVCTSGASLAELARSVKRAGAETVSCWVLARSEMKIF